mmetsp:Transcript_42786/g.76846  ORF Transcript_42786/g.76846 Transcript_42786/m.76846 type:complete len:202 (+) Transcript_42786:1959-2564(+)
MSSWLTTLSSATSTLRPTMQSIMCGVTEGWLELMCLKSACTLRGMANQKRLPTPISELTPNKPCMMAICLVQMWRPRPVPPKRRGTRGPACSKGRNSLFSASGAIPCPLSTTSKSRAGLFTRSVLQTTNVDVGLFCRSVSSFWVNWWHWTFTKTLPTTVYLMAFDIRFSRTPRIRFASPSIIDGTSSANQAGSTVTVSDFW